jgi:hypothetical protein
MDYTGRHSTQHREIMKQNIARTLLTTALLASLPAIVKAQIAFYPLSGSPSPSLAPTIVDPNATAGSLSFAGSTASQAAGSGQLFVSVATPSATTSAATAVSSNSFFSFVVAPKPGFAVNLTSMSFSFASLSDNGGYVLRTSVDGFAANLSVGTQPVAGPLTSFTVPLSGAAFQGLSNPLTIRLYSFGGPSATTNPVTSFKNITLNGTLTAISVVPEPSALWLSIFGAVVVFSLRPKRSVNIESMESV